MNYLYKHQNILALLVSLLLLGACTDVLDETPSDKVSIDRIITKGTIANFRTNSYVAVPKSFTQYSASCLLESYSDDAFKAGNTSNNYKWHDGQLSITSTFMGSSVWNSCWKGIRRCNLAMDYLPQSKAPEDVVSAKNIERYTEEVKLLRAWYHFILIKNFGALPFVEEAYSPGFEGWNEITRPSYEAISTRIAEECDEVIANNVLDYRWQVADENAYVNKAMAFALKSRVLLYNASPLNNPDNDRTKWQEARDAAQQCVDSIVPEYSLLPIEDYSLLFNGSYTTENSEIIYRSSSNGSSTTNSSNGVDLYLYGSTGRSSNCGAVPSQELVDCFELKDGSLPVSQYDNADHTAVTLNAAYSENAGDDPYAGRDARFYHSIVYNGCDYGQMKNKTDTVIVYTYEGNTASGFNEDPLSQIDAYKRRSCTGYYTRKYRSAAYWGATSGDINNHKVFFRLAEIYLNLAEAECELNNLPQAIAALDVIRTRAGQPNIENVPGFQNTQDYLRQRIRNERRVELCFEEHRFYDQRRWEILEETNGVMTGMKVTTAGGDNGPFSYERVKIEVPRVANTNKYLVLPIAFEEARKMTGLGQPEAWQ